MGVALSEGGGYTPEQASVGVEGGAGVLVHRRIDPRNSWGTRLFADVHPGEFLDSLPVETWSVFAPGLGPGTNAMSSGQFKNYLKLPGIGGGNRFCDFGGRDYREFEITHGKYRGLFKNSVTLSGIGRI